MSRIGWVDGLLLGATLVGGALAWGSGRERARLTAEWQRLASKTGDVAVGDPSMAYFRALPTGEPLHFVWRTYTPPNYRTDLNGSLGGSSSSWTRDARDSVARVRFREDGEGRLEVYAKFDHSSSRSAVADRATTDLIRGRWDQIVVEQLGTKQDAAVDVGRQAVLLRLSLPPSIRDEARRTLDPAAFARVVPVLFELKIGPEASSP